MKKEKEYKIGSDFELHTLKKTEKSEKKDKFYGSFQNGSDFDLYPVKGKRDEDASNKDLHALRYMNLGFLLITPILMGVLLGSYIDTKIHIRPIATILFLFFGVVASFYNLFRILKSP